jgi:predicted RNase H-like HicB family nuclease
MEKIINLHIEKLPEGLYLATSNTIQGLVAQGRTIAETIEIARDIAKKLIEAQDGQAVLLTSIADNFDYPLVIGL